MNVLVATVRCRIAPVSGTPKHSCGLARAHGVALACDLANGTFKILAFHLRRAVSLSLSVS